MTNSPRLKRPTMTRGGSWGENSLRSALPKKSLTPSVVKKKPEERHPNPPSSRGSTPCVPEDRAAARRKSITEREAGLTITAASMDKTMRKKAVRAMKSKYRKQDIVLLKKVFDEYDKDGDGSIQIEELYKELHKQKHFTQRNDGRKLSLSERQASRGVVRTRQISAQSGNEPCANGVFLTDHCGPIFAAMDRDGDGTVTFMELLKTVYPHCPQGEWETMLNWVTPQPIEEGSDSDPEGPQVSDAKRAEIAQLFSMYDTTQSGELNRQDLHTALQFCSLNMAEIDDMISQFDSDGNGLMNLNEFVVLMASTGAFGN